MTSHAPDGDAPLDFDALGLDVAEVLFRAESVGVVRGVRLADGRRAMAEALAWHLALAAALREHAAEYLQP